MTALRVLSLGAGVQSSTVALMMACGEIEPADAAIFADTMAEPEATYRYLDWLEPRLPFPVHRVTHGDLGEEILRIASGEAKNNNGRPPFFVKNPDGSRGILKRQCTGDYKIDVIRKKVRELLGVSKGARVPAGKRAQMVIGISRDEAGRMKVSPDKWSENTYPLVEMRFTRWDCLQWLKRNSFPIPTKSACVFCPFRRVAEWRNMRDRAPADFQRAIQIDRAIRSLAYQGLVGECYVSDAMVPLEEMDLSTAAELGQANLWDDECDGVCGL
ncbi:MAG: hypothetical protein P4L92_23125 [Rudaea sp.]|nr:hypothetical protein [Rudaea sp.]